VSGIEFHCRICGLREDVPPWGDDGKTPQFDFCNCCGVEHGYQDCSPAGSRKFRADWIASGGVWSDERSRPIGWQLEQQLGQVPEDFR